MSTALWIPGRGELALDERAAARAVEEYDADLMLGQDRRTGDWVVLIKRDPPYPVYGLGPRLPSPDEIKRQLYTADVRRHGGKIVEGLERVNSQLRKELRDRASDSTGEAAEALEWGFRKLGAHPFPRIFIPKGV
jgi:hypothetical protein